MTEGSDRPPRDPTLDLPAVAPVHEPGPALAFETHCWCVECVRRRATWHLSPADPTSPPSTVTPPERQLTDEERAVLARAHRESVRIVNDPPPYADSLSPFARSRIESALKLLEEAVADIKRGRA